MTERPHFTPLAAATTFLCTFVGCGSNSRTDDPAVATALPVKASVVPENHAHNDHAHPTTGPHGGDLVDLGAGEYHAEFVHDKSSESITVYILDGAAIDAVAVAATEITLNLSHGARNEQFTLKASPDTNDPSGHSSRFVAAVKGLIGKLHAADAMARLVATIDGRSYRGELRHRHGGQDHDHTHPENEQHL